VKYQLCYTEKSQATFFDIFYFCTDYDIIPNYPSVIKRLFEWMTLRRPGSHFSSMSDAVAGYM